MNQTTLESYEQDYQRIVSDLPGQQHDKINQLRKLAWQAFSEQGFPAIREEEWRYTNVSAIEKKRFKAHVAHPNNDLDEQELADYQLTDCYQIVLHNGKVLPSHSDYPAVADAIEIRPIANAIAEFPELFDQYFASVARIDKHNFVAYNTAWFSDGVMLLVKANQVLDKPLQIIHWVDAEDVSLNTRNLIILENNSQADIISIQTGKNGAYLTTMVNEICLQENAALKFSQIQLDSAKAFNFSGCYVHQSAYSRFKHDNFALGSLLNRNDVHTDLFNAAECELNGLYLGDKRQHIDNHTRMNHREPNAVSREFYKGILAQRARGVFQGRVYVAEQAQKTDSEMTNRNLLLSSDAEVDTKPQLEIYADDVKCAHGVTVGELDEKSVFYLMSRGMSETDARNMLTFAFANEMVDKLASKPLRQLVLDQVIQCFSQNDFAADLLTGLDR